MTSVHVRTPVSVAGGPDAGWKVSDVSQTPIRGVSHCIGVTGGCDDVTVKARRI